MQRAAEHVANAHTGANAGRQAGATARVLRRIAQRVGCLQLGVGLHIQHTHGAQLLSRLAGRLEVLHVESLQRQAERQEIILRLGAHARAQLFGQADQLGHAVLGRRLAQQVLQLGEQHRAQTGFDILWCG